MPSSIISLTDLAQKCALETDRFFRDQPYDPQYCFELFRLAVVGRQELAWEAVYSQYRGLVGRWVQQHSGFAASGEEAQYFINRAFEKIWAALTPEKFAQFPDLGYLLRYLKMCVHSVISDYHRALEPGLELPLERPLEAEPVIAAGNPRQDPEKELIGRTQRLSFWNALCERLNGEKEYQVIYGSYMLALKPGDLFDAFPGLFADVDEVYRIKQNILARLRRDGELAESLGLFD